MSTSRPGQPLPRSHKGLYGPKSFLAPHRVQHYPQVRTGFGIVDAHPSTRPSTDCAHQSSAFSTACVGIVHTPCAARPFTATSHRPSVTRRWGVRSAGHGDRLSYLAPNVVDVQRSAGAVSVADLYAAGPEARRGVVRRAGPAARRRRRAERSRRHAAVQGGHRPGRRHAPGARLLPPGPRDRSSTRSSTSPTAASPPTPSPSAPSCTRAASSPASAAHRTCTRWSRASRPRRASTSTPRSSERRPSCAASSRSATASPGSAGPSRARSPRSSTGRRKRSSTSMARAAATTTAPSPSSSAPPSRRSTTSRAATARWPASGPAFPSSTASPRVSVPAR